MGKGKKRKKGSELVQQLHAHTCFLPFKVQSNLESQVLEFLLKLLILLPQSHNLTLVLALLVFEVLTMSV